MNRIESIIKASNETLNLKTASILVEVAKKNFITSGELIEMLECDDMNQRSVISNIGVLIKRELIEKSGDGYITTNEAVEILTKAADIYAEHNPTSEVAKKVEKANMVGKKRITGLMTDLIELVESVIPVAYRPKIMNRSNYEIFLEKRTLGVRSIEIRHKGFLRLCTYKVDQEFLDELLATNEVVRNKESGVVNYIDFNFTEENIKLVFKIFNKLTKASKNDSKNTI